MTKKKSRKRASHNEDRVNTNALNDYIRKGKTFVISGHYTDAIESIKKALHILTQSPTKQQRRYESLWSQLGNLYVQTNQLEDAQEVYQKIISKLFASNRVQKLQKIIQEANELNISVDLVTPLLLNGKPKIIHQLSQPIALQIFHQAIQRYEERDESTLYNLILELLPRIKKEFMISKGGLESLTSGLDNIKGILEKEDIESIPDTELLSDSSEDGNEQKLYEIWNKRVHGTYMYRGAGYGIRVALIYLLDMLDAASNITRIVVEGIEDFDVYYSSQSTTSPRLYVQVKSRNEGQPAWSISKLASVINSFAEVHCADNTANFLFVTDYHFGQKTTLTNILEYDSLWDFDRAKDIQEIVIKKLEPKFKEHDNFDLETFLKRIQFKVIERNLTDTLINRIANTTNSVLGIAARYYESLFEQLHKFAERDKTSEHKKGFSKTELESYLYELKSTIDIKSLEQPLRKGNLELLSFINTPQPDPNYYLGAYADLRHVLAGQDIQRPELMNELSVKLVRNNFCIIRAPSGAGKTTIMYRFAYEYRHSFSVYRVQFLEKGMVSNCVRFIKALKPTKFTPVLILIDDLSRKQGWYELVKPLLEVSNIYIIATTREDEWNEIFIQGVNAENLKVSLSTGTARAFHQMLKERGHLHPDYPHWKEPFEASKTNGNALFLEYTYLLTQGQRIQDVLQEQVERIAARSSLQLNLLRFICTAHTLGGWISADTLPNLLKSGNESLYTHIGSLIQEHLIIQEQEYYIGLHEVRSKFLLKLTHQYPPPTVEATIKSLIRFLPINELILIVENLCKTFPDEAKSVMPVLSKRISYDATLAEIIEIIRQLYKASEWIYAQIVKEHINNYHVYPVEIGLFGTSISPTAFRTDKFLEMEIFRQEARLAFSTVPKRTNERFEQLLGQHFNLENLANRFDDEKHIPTKTYFINWFKETNENKATQFLDTIDIKLLIQELKIQTLDRRAVSLLYHIWMSNADVYDRIILALGGKEQLIERFLGVYPIVTKFEVDEKNKTIIIHLLPDETLSDLEGDKNEAHDKVIYLIHLARRLFPFIERVKTKGFFSTGQEYVVGQYDPATKDLLVENLASPEDVEKNRIWLEIITTQYRANTWYSYLQKQDSIRSNYISSLILVKKLLQEIRRPKRKLDPAQRKTIGLLYAHQSFIGNERKNELLAPFAQNDSGEDIHQRLLRGVYHLRPGIDEDVGTNFTNFLSAVDRGIAFLCEYLLDKENRNLRIVGTNLATAIKKLERFDISRKKIELRHTEHCSLLPFEKWLIETLHEATQYIFDPNYEHFWTKAEKLMEQKNFLISCLEKDHFSLAEAVRNDLMKELPKLTILKQESQSWQLQSLTTLDIFVVLAQQYREEIWEVQLQDIEDDLKSKEIHAKFDSIIIPEDALAGAWGILPIIFSVDSLIDIDNKIPRIIDDVFNKQFNERQSFTIIITNKQNESVWPVVYTWGYWDRKKWLSLKRRNQTPNILEICTQHSDKLSEYCEQLKISIGEEPPYSKAITFVYSTLVDLSNRIAQLRQELALGRKSFDEVSKQLEADLQAEEDFASQLDYIKNFQPPSEFQEIHTLILEFIQELGLHIEDEVKALNHNDEVSLSLASVHLASIQNTMGSSKSQLKTILETDYSELDISSKFGIIYAVVKNYEHFGHYEY